MVKNQLDVSKCGIDDAIWNDLLERRDTGESKLISWVRAWCSGLDSLRRIEEFLCTLLEDDLISTDRLINTGVDAMAQLIHLRIYSGNMIQRRFDFMNYEVIPNENRFFRL